MDLGLEGQVVVVTGGTDGLGLALSHRLVAEGAKVAICGRDEERLAAARSGLEAAGGTVLAHRCDVADPVELERFCGAVLEHFDRVDGLVNNAGRHAAHRVLEVDDAAFQADLDLKLLAAHRAARALAPSLSVTGGSILNVLAIAGKHPGAGSAPTSISRAAGLALTKALSKDLGPLGVRCNAILIGLVDSGQWRRMAAQSGRALEEFEAELAVAAGIPLGRMGRAEEFADVAAFLLSPRAAYVTGVGLNVDGGLSSAV